MIASAIALAVLIAASAPVFAQDRLPAAGDNPTAPIADSVSPQNPLKLRSGKERLGEKWTDEQRIDNCNVPIDKRGVRPRSDACSQTPKE